MKLEAMDRAGETGELMFGLPEPRAYEAQVHVPIAGTVPLITPTITTMRLSVLQAWHAAEFAKATKRVADLVHMLNGMHEECSDRKRVEETYRRAVALVAFHNEATMVLSEVLA